MSQKQSISGHSRPRERNGPQLQTRESMACLGQSGQNSLPAEMSNGERGRRSWKEIWGQTICNLECNGKKLVRSMGDMVPTGSSIWSCLPVLTSSLRFGLGKADVRSTIIRLARFARLALHLLSFFWGIFFQWGYIATRLVVTGNHDYFLNTQVFSELWLIMKARLAQKYLDIIR